MCGIVGVMADKLSTGDILKFKDMFTFAQVRGDDGAGIIAVPKKDNIGNVRTRKTLWSSGHLVTTKDYDDVTKGELSILIGHARQPTKGASKIDNVHPHHSGHIHLVHNGTMHYVGGSTVGINESDSKVICKTIAEKGAKHFVENSSGAYCLLWVDTEKQTMNFLRNRERPLWVVEERFTKNSPYVHRMWWASELWMVTIALSRYAGYDKDCFKAFQLPVNDHYEFPLPNQTYGLRDPVVTKIEKPTSYSSGTMWDGYFFDDDQDVTGTGTGKSVVPFRLESSKSTSDNSKNSTSVTTSGGFKYTPPVERVDGTPPFVSPMRVLERSRDDARLATAKQENIERTKQPSTDEEKEANPSGGTFPRGAYNFSQDTCTSAIRPIESFAEKDRKRVMDLVSGGPCVWCSTKPVFVGPHTPLIYPVRFTQTRGEYVCHACVSDLDVQRMVGIN
jgi:predicted glutamine amidotransferase